MVKVAVAVVKVVAKASKTEIRHPELGLGRILLLTHCCKMHSHGEHPNVQQQQAGHSGLCDKPTAANKCKKKVPERKDLVPDLVIRRLLL